jgi:dihydroxyacid dehydratase/phosphogluconate dehydratase
MASKEPLERAPNDPRQYSRVVVDGLSQAPSRAMLRAWSPPTPRADRGLLAKYAHHVSSAANGAVTDLHLND